MARLFPIALLLGALVLGGGCAGSRLPEERPQTLRQVNKQLDGRWARIRQTNGRLIERVENVRVNPDTTTFYDRMEEKQRTIPTRLVRAVQVKKSSHSKRGFIAGAVPGLFLTALGVAGRVDNSENIWNALSVMTIGGGLMIAAIGGALVGTVGSAIGEDEWGTIYQRPVEEYRRSSLEGEAQTPD